MTMPRLFIILFAFVSVLSACQMGGKSKQPTYIVGFSQCLNNNDWRQKMTREVIMEASQSPEIKLLIENGENDNRNQIQDIENFIAQGVDLLIISPNEAEPLRDVVEKAYNSGIPVILLDRKVNTDKYTTFIGGNNEEIGFEAGTLAKAMLNEDSHVIEIWGSKLSSPAQERHLGFRRAFSDSTQIRFTEVNGEWLRDTAYANLKKVLVKKQKIDLVYAHNDQMAMGVYRLFEELKTPKIPIIGIDGLSVPEEGMEGVMQGKLHASFLYPSGGDKAIQVAREILKGKAVPKLIELNTVLIDKSNVAVLKEQADEMLRKQKRIELQRYTIDENSHQIRTQRMVMLLLIGVVLLIGILAFTVLKSKRKISKQNKKLEEQAQQLNSYNIVLKERQTEIELQAEELRTANENLGQQAKTVQRQNEHIMSSIKYAKTIQQSMLPLAKNMNREYDTFNIFLPKDVVSGDFYWFFDGYQQAKEKLPICVFAVVDCTGHGVPGAFMSMIGNRIFSNIVLENAIYDPAKILELMDERVFLALKQDQTMNNDGMDVALCVLQKEQDDTVKLMYAGAKRPLFLYRAQKNEIGIVKGCRRSIGGKRTHSKEVPFETETLTLHKNDMLYLSSDGFIDQNSESRQRFGRDRFVQTLQQIAVLPLAQQKEELETRLRKHMDGQEQRDDITIVGVRI